MSREGWRVVDEPAVLEQRLAQGAELSPGEVAALLRVGRTTVHAMLNSGKIRYTETPGGHRRCHPDDVRAALEERRRLRRGGEPGDGPVPPQTPPGQ